MWIKLNEIPDEGRDFELSEAHFELKEELREVLKGEPFRIGLFILPVGQAYQVKARVESNLPLTCSFCARDFKAPIRADFSDLLLTSEKRKLLISNPKMQASDDLSVTEIDGNQYNFGEAIREFIALQEPFQPSCKEDCKGLCFSCGADLNEETCDCPHKKSVPSSAFSVLKDIKLD